MNPLKTKAKHSQHSFIFFFAVIFTLALWLRISDINTRPMHGDEANQAWQLQQLYEDGIYNYTPEDYHGPTLYYFGRAWLWLQGSPDFKDIQASHLRSLSVFFSLATLLLFLTLKQELSAKGCLILSLTFAASPAFVFYSQYFIQESSLIFFTCLWLIALWKWTQHQRNIWLFWLSIALGMMLATKETFIIALFASLCSLILTSFFIQKQKQSFAKWNASTYLIAFCPLAVIHLCFYSSFFQNPQGIFDAFTAYKTHIARGLGSDTMPIHTTSGAAHSKPWWMYFQWASWNYEHHSVKIISSILKNSPIRPISEHLSMLSFALATGLALIRLKKQSSFFIYIFFFSILVWLIYSFIPYKTPWCILTALMGSMILGSLMIVKGMELFKSSRWKLICLVPLSLLSYDLYRQARLINQEIYANSNNPWAYVYTVDDVERFRNNIDEITSLVDEPMSIHVIAQDYWPIPWYLKHHSKVGFWDEGRPQGDLRRLPIVICSSENESIPEELSTSHEVDLFGLRPGVHYLMLIRKDLWEKLLSSRS